MRNGTAAGTAVALALETQANNIRDISIEKLKKQLEHDRMVLDPEKHNY
ncbi:MAG: FAD-dependent oxidoreductase [Candidatus Omnitrophica bacterium]|nr:FAD-dependent oxidoreductase [Candidatus Omnitrophota bacterium]